MPSTTTILGASAITVPSDTTANRPGVEGGTYASVSAAAGMLRLNLTTTYLEYFNGDAWVAIAAPPQITSVSPSTFSGESGTSITVNGAFFDSGAVVKVVTQAGTEISAGTTSFVNASQVTFTIPRDFTSTEGPLDVKIVNASGLSYQIDNALYTGNVPAWTTTAGSLGTFVGGVVSASATATDADSALAGHSIVYSVASGTLPTSTTLNSSTGAITGTNTVTGSNTYSFTLRATDNAGNTADRAFTITTQVNYFGSGADGAGSY